VAWSLTIGSVLRCTGHGDDVKLIGLEVGWCVVLKMKLMMDDVRGV
jgi:hypothetical protein